MSPRLTPTTSFAQDRPAYDAHAAAPRIRRTCLPGGWATVHDHFAVHAIKTGANVDLGNNGGIGRYPDLQRHLRWVESLKGSHVRPNAMTTPVREVVRAFAN